MLDLSIGGAALAGLLSFFSPCILPMVPFYLAYMAGTSVTELREDGALPPGVQGQLLLRAAAFALGVTTIFVLLGFGATSLGRVVAEWRQWLGWIAAAVLILFGLHFLGVLRIPLLYREARVQAGGRPGSAAGAYVMGLAFGFGWTPCVGPALAAILMIAGGMGEPWRGGLLLLVYGLAMTLPFVGGALFAGPFLRWIARNRGLMRHVERAMGALLVLFGLLIATNSVNLIADWMLRNFDWSRVLT